MFPKTGRNNADGTPKRLSPPFNTREPFQLKGHAEEANSWIGGLQTYLWNKMVLEPVVEVAKNKDFYGNKLWDDQAPWYKRVLQGADSVLGEQLNPASVSGATRAKQEGGGVGGQALAYAGFQPAAKYLSYTALENRIAGAYHGTFSVAARQALAAPDKGNMGKVAGRVNVRDEHQYQFSRLGKGDQISIGRDMDKTDFQRFVVKNPNVGVSKPVRAQLMKERGLL